MILKSLLLLALLTTPEQTIKELSVKPRPTGENQWATDILLKQLKSYNPTTQSKYNNVVAIHNSSDKNNTDTIVVGAHYDSVKRSPGADDNASGTAVVVELAKRLQQRRTNKTWVFVLFSGEEQGLLGSREFSSSLTTQPNLMINLDMIGHLSKSSISTFPDVGKILKSLQNKYPFAEGITFKGRAGGASDHVSFKCPTLFIHTGLHRHYHQPSDTIDTLNIDGVNKITMYCYDLIITIDGKALDTNDYDDLLKGLKEYEYNY